MGSNAVAAGHPAGPRAEGHRPVLQGRAGAADADPDLADPAASRRTWNRWSPLVDFPLPTEPQIRATLDGMIARNTAAGALKVDLGPAGAERLAKAALGLTAFEAENAFARSMVDDGRLTDDDIALVQEEKRQIVQKSGVLEVVRLDRQPGRHRRPGEPQDLAAQAERFLARRGRRLRSAGAEGCAGHRGSGLRQVADRQGDGRRPGRCRWSGWTSAGCSAAWSGRASRTCAPRCAPPRRSRRA